MSNLTTIPLIDTSVKNEKCIPAMTFIEEIPDWCSKYGAEQLVEELNVFHNKFKYMEAQTQKHSESIKMKIPDIEKAIDSVNLVKEEHSKQTEKINLDFMVAHNLWAKAEVPIKPTVCLWLGADVLCEYTHDEALELLNKNLSNAKVTLKTNEETIDFLRDQITTCEVNISRSYNYYVETQKKKEK